MRNITKLRRELDTLKKQISALKLNATEFILYGGGTFTTEQDPVSYIAEHGATTPSGRRIAAYKPPAEEKPDALTKSLYDYIDECIQRGDIPFSKDLRSDETP